MELTVLVLAKLANVVQQLEPKLDMPRLLSFLRDHSESDNHEKYYSWSGKNLHYLGLRSQSTYFCQCSNKCFSLHYQCFTNRSICSECYTIFLSKKQPLSKKSPLFSIDSIRPRGYWKILNRHTKLRMTFVSVNVM